MEYIKITQFDVNEEEILNKYKNYTIELLDSDDVIKWDLINSIYKGKKKGHGIIKYFNNEIDFIEGNFIDGKMDGLMTYKYKNNDVHKKLYYNGEYNGLTLCKDIYNRLFKIKHEYKDLNYQIDITTWHVAEKDEEQQVAELLYTNYNTNYIYKFVLDHKITTIYKGEALASGTLGKGEALASGILGKGEALASGILGKEVSDSLKNDGIIKWLGIMVCYDENDNNIIGKNIYISNNSMKILYLINAIRTKKYTEIVKIDELNDCFLMNNESANVKNHKINTVIYSGKIIVNNLLEFVFDDNCAYINMDNWYNIVGIVKNDILIEGKILYNDAIYECTFNNINLKKLMIHDIDLYNITKGATNSKFTLKIYTWALNNFHYNYNIKNRNIVIKNLELCNIANNDFLNILYCKGEIEFICENLISIIYLGTFKLDFRTKSVILYGSGKYYEKDVLKYEGVWDKISEYTEYNADGSIKEIHSKNRKNNIDNITTMTFN